MLGIYCRISQLKEGTDRSIDDQAKAGISLANKLNVPYILYTDEGLSGTLNINDRPQLSQLINDIVSGNIDKVYVYDQSRLERSPEARFQLNKIFDEFKIDLYTDGGLVGKDIESEFSGDLMSIINSYYVKVTSQKIKRVLKGNAENNRVHSVLPYGFQKGKNNKMIIHIEESEIIKQIFSLSLSGIGTNKIAETLNHQGVPTRYNKIKKGTITHIDKYDGRKTIKRKEDVKWSGNTIRSIIKNTVYKGWKKWGDELYPCPQILDEFYWQKVNDNLSKNRNNSGKKVDHKYLLKGLLRCGKCGRNYYGKRRVDLSDNYYMCSSKRFKSLNCGNRSINIDILDKLIWTKFIGDGYLSKYITEYLDSNKNNDHLKIIEEEHNQVEKELSAIKKKKDKSLELVFAGLISDKDIADKMKSLNRQEADLLLKLNHLSNQIAQFTESKIFNSGSLNELNNVKDINFNTRREVLHKYIKLINIYWNSDNTYYIEINFNLPDMNNVVYALDRNYKYAHTLLNEDQGSLDVEIIALNDQLSNKLKQEAIDFRLEMSSFQNYSKLKEESDVQADD